ncbi:MAG: hypothetical protein HPY66_2409 [Firmicutes bacterium]|nr:hypothetical protein [Bacillota bacterium]MDI6707035.1 Fur family transcriptional regulator [Bacillota bacterium]
MISKESIEEKLKDNNYKLTPQRKAIIEALFDCKGHFVTAEEIFIKTMGKYPQTNFSTVYRNLEILEEIDIIHKTSIKDGAAVYELICDDSHHHHIICSKCGKTEIIKFCPLEQMKISIEDKDFTLTGHKFELYGHCNKCKEKETS